MSTTKNSDLMTRVIYILVVIAGRRTSLTISSAFIEAILKTLEKKYDFLKHIKIKNMTYFEGDPINAIEIKKSEINSIAPEKIGEAIESIIRVLCMDLEEETGLFFLQELKEKLDSNFHEKLEECGVDLELLRLEQRHLFEQLERKKQYLHSEDETADSEFKIEIPNYSWKEVATFKYKNNVCFLYDKHGKPLDRLHVSKIIEYYVRTLTDFGKLVLKKDNVELTEREYRLLELLHDRDLDEESAKYFLDATTAEFTYTLQQLVRYEYLQYVTFDEIRITEKGIRTVEERRATQKEKNFNPPLSK